MTLGDTGLRHLQERATDLVWRLTAQTDVERRIIAVDIDERSLQQIGPWPWPRDQQARLLDQIAVLGAQQQILDVVFSDSRPGDDILALSIARNQPVLAQIFALEPGNQAATGQPAGALGWAGCPPLFPEATGYLANASGLVAARTGHITPRTEVDGVLRHQPAVICHQDQSYPALGLAALFPPQPAAASDAAATSSIGAHSTITLERGTVWWGPHWWLGGSQLATRPVPLGAEGDIRIPWHLHPDSFISLSAADILAGRVPEGLLTNAWVLVGSSAFGLNDTIATPFAGTSSGMQAHLQLLAGLIDERTPYTPRESVLVQTAAAVLGLLLLLALCYRPVHNRLPGSNKQADQLRFPLYLLPLAATAWALLLWLLHAILLTQAALWVGWLDPALLVLLVGSALGVFEHAQSRIDREQLYSHLSSYLPAPVAAALALQPPSGAIKASTRHVSVLFADIRNFSAFCEARPPEEAAAVLHAFFSKATQVVQQHGGVIESFQGDAIIAVWNATPEPRHCGHGNGKHHPRQALKAAVHLLAAMHGVLPDPAPAGLEPLSLGIGVETGPAMTGSFGLASRRTHMVMGRTVTIASRLVGMTAELAHPILVGEGLAAQVGANELQSMGTFLLEGLRVPHHIYAHPLSAETTPH